MPKCSRNRRDGAARRNNSVGDSAKKVAIERLSSRRFAHTELQGIPTGMFHHRLGRMEGGHRRVRQACRALAARIRYPAQIDFVHGLRVNPRKPVALLLLVGLVTGPACGFAQSDAYGRAFDAFDAGDYEMALELLTVVYTNLQHSPAAPRSGQQAASLHYNLGATYFRLGRYDAAYGQFRRISADPELGMMARYNLGLVEARRGNTFEAETHFRGVHALAKSVALRNCAAARLGIRLVADCADAPELIDQRIR
jgi:tetratricopeptide (TPR) repeat protein